MFLEDSSHEMSGNVLDIGGKKINRRGKFRPPLQQVTTWKYLNIDPSTKPDYCCSAEDLPIESDSIDGFLLCEVLEHLEYPEKVLDEVFRVLKPSGSGWITIPFLYQIHADPNDFQRWSEVKIRNTLKQTGFSYIEIRPMGSAAAVIYDLCHACLNRSLNHGRILNRSWSRLLRSFQSLAFRFDKKLLHQSNYITTGYAIIVRK